MKALENLDPRQALTLSYYTNPKSETFGDLKNSCIRAGFSASYGDSITGKTVKWLSQNVVDDVKRIMQAEKNLDRYISLKNDKLETKNDIEKAKLQIDVSKFVLKTRARSKYSEDKEIETPNVTINIMNYNDMGANPMEAKDVEVKDVEA